MPPCHLSITDILTDKHNVLLLLDRSVSSTRSPAETKRKMGSGGELPLLSPICTPGSSRSPLLAPGRFTSLGRDGDQSRGLRFAMGFKLCHVFCMVCEGSVSLGMVVLWLSRLLEGISGRAHPRMTLVDAGMGSRAFVSYYVGSKTWGSYHAAWRNSIRGLGFWTSEGN